MKQQPGWIGVDLDGTLAVYDIFRGVDHVGEPIIPMLERVKRWLADGKRVKILTARVDGGTVALNLGNPDGKEFQDVERVKRPIREWCKKHLGVELEITNSKDYGMIELWDDRCITIEANTGRILTASESREVVTECLVCGNRHTVKVEHHCGHEYCERCSETTNHFITRSR
jgi:hypothetical protein